MYIDQSSNEIQTITQSVQTKKSLVYIASSLDSTRPLNKIATLFFMMSNKIKERKTDKFSKIPGIVTFLLLWEKNHHN